MTVARPQEGAFCGQTDLLGSQACCGHAPDRIGSHQSQERLGSLAAAAASDVPVRNTAL